MSNPLERNFASLSNSPIIRLLLLGLLTLLLLIPISMIDRLVSERQERRQVVIDEVTEKWGQEQTITGPALVVPFTQRWKESAPGSNARGSDSRGSASGGGASGGGGDSGGVARTETRYAVFLPQQLRIQGTIDAELRHRGIFTVPVYKLSLTVAGEFDRPNFAALGINPASIAWDRAHLAVGISDVRAIAEEAALTWNQKTFAFLPGTGGFSECDSGIHAQVSLRKDPSPKFTFSFPLSLNGSLSLFLVPFAQNTVAELQSNFSHPSFQGNWLPTERTVADNHFQAKWTIPFLGRNYPQAWISDSDMSTPIAQSRFGLELVNPVDHYRMADRSVKYAVLFILLTFAAIWLIEVLAALRVHPIQYLLLGGALCLFYLLELSLSEHLGFPLAYSLAAAAIVGLVAFYSAAVLRGLARALVVAVGVALLYVYLYVLLMNEDYALLIGSVGLFAILAVIMFTTRRVDWYKVNQ
ncbi:MAG: cell envelope integrity protein CreD [Phycisphaeraceae bacterium]|nr:cell envelope integrity protein CreD [Phycisphaeraceae bacterium]